MTQVVSRVNGLKIAIPADARNVVHRFAISGGGNELVFEPLTRKDFNQSKSTENNPMGIGSGGDEPVEAAQVELYDNLKDDDGQVDPTATQEVKETPAPKAKKTTRKPRKAATKKEADEAIL